MKGQKSNTAYGSKKTAGVVHKPESYNDVKRALDAYLKKNNLERKFVTWSR